MRLRFAVLVMALFVTVLFAGPALAQDDGDRDTVQVGSIDNVAPGASFDVPVSMFFDVIYNGITVPLAYTRQGGGTPDVDLDTASLNSGFAAGTDVKIINIDRANQRFLMAALPLFTPVFLPTASMSLFGTVSFTAHVGAAQQIMEIDTAFFPPSNSLLMSAPSAPNGVVPLFVPGEICINGPCGGNNPPVLDAVADVNVDEGGHADMPLSANDTDGDAIALTATGLPAFATLTDNGDGTGNISVDPGFDDAGSYPIAVIASDGTDADTQSATITVNDVNRAPELDAVSDVSVDEGGHADMPLSSTDADGDAIALTATGLPAFATLTDNGDGTGNISVDPGFDDAGSYPISVIASDGTDADTQSATITVNDVNRAPVLDAVSDVSVDEGGHADMPLSSTDADGDAIALSTVGLPSFATLTDNGDGTGNISVDPGTEDAGSYPISVIASDGTDADTQSATITVNDVNVPPVLDAVSDISVDEGGHGDMPLSATDDDGDALTLTTVGLPTFATLTDNGDGTGNISVDPGFDDAGSYPISVIASDGTDADTQSATITVNDVNRAPELDAVADANVDEGGHADMPLNATDADGDAISLSVDGLPSFATLTDNGDGTGNISVDPGCSDAGSYPISVIASDGTDADTQSATITVNDVPTDLVSTTNNLVFNYQLGSGPPAQQGFTVSNDGCGEVDVEAVATGSVIVNPSGGTTPQAFTADIDTTGLGEGTFNETITVSEVVPEERGTQATEVVINVTINVTSEPNQKPNLDPVADVEMDEGSHEDMPLSASDPNGDPLSFSGLNLPSFASLTDNGDGTGNIALDPGFDDAGVYNISVVVSDGSLADTQDVQITVNDVNRKPALDAIADDAVDEGGHLDIPLSASDPDGDGLAFSVFNLQSFMTLTDNGDGTGNISVDPGCDDDGGYGIVVIVTDDGSPNLADSQAVLVTVNDVPTDLQASTTDLTFDYVVGDPPPATQPVTVTNNGCGEVDVDASATGNVTVDPASGTTPQVFDIGVDVAGLGPGTYNETVTVTETVPPLEAALESVEISVTINVTEEAECADSIIVSHRTVDINQQDTVYVDIYWRNCAPSLGASLPLWWDPSILTLDTVIWGPRVSVIATRPVNIDQAAGNVLLGLVPVVEPPLAPGAGLFASLCFSIDDCSSKPVDIDSMFIVPGGSYLFVDDQSNPVYPEFSAGSVTLLGGEPLVDVSPNALSYEFEEGSDVLTDCDWVWVSNAGCGDLYWMAMEEADWLSVSPTSGMDGDSAQICVDATGLEVGEYCDTVWFSEVPAAAGVLPTFPVEVCVTITEQPEPPVLWLDSAYYHFSATVGEGDPPSQTLLISNIGGGALTWQANNTSGWLSTDPSAGTAPSTVDVNVSIDGLLAGMYSDTIMVSSPEAINSPQYAIVDLWLDEAAPEADTVWVGSGTGMQFDTVCIQVDFQNTQELAGISLPLVFDSPNVELLSVSFEGSRVENIGTKPVEIDNDDHTVCIAVIPIEENLIPPGKGLLATLCFLIADTEGCDGEVQSVNVTIDTTFIEPGCEYLFVDADAQAVVPEFYEGQIEIICPEPACEICGIVYCELPFEGALVEVWTEYPSGQIIESVYTDAEGHFCISDLDCPGCFDLRVTMPGYCPVIENVCLPNGILHEITLEPAGDPVVTPWVADYWTIDASVFDWPLQPGDVITAYDPEMTLCGVATVQTEGAFTIHVYGDDTLTVEDEGAEEGDVITLVWNCDCELQAENLWTNHGFFEEEFNWECVRCNDIELCQNWTLFSFNVQPDNDELESILSALDPYYSYVIGSECGYGARTWQRNRPDFLNDLHYLDNEHGYWLKVSPDFQGPYSLEVCGLPEAPDKPLELCANWNLISYLPNEADELTHALGSIDGDYIHVFGVDCNVGIQTWDANRPEFLNDLICLRPTHGYWVKTTNATTLTYPTSDYDCSDGPDGPARRSYTIMTNTTITPYSSDIWSITPSSISGLAEGDILRVYDEDGVLCGEAYVRQNGAFLVHVIGDDPSSEADEGATAGSVLTFRSDGRELTSLNPVVWSERESQEVSLTQPQRALPTDYALLQNYPNPFNPATRIDFRLPQEGLVTLEIYNVLGQSVRTLLDDEWMDAGVHGVTWDGLTQDGVVANSGVYFYRLSAGSFTDVRKMTLLK